MDTKEAIRRIKQHNRIHFAKEYPKAILITEALDMAIEALEKQVPKKPKIEIHFTLHPYFHFYNTYRCPNCNHLVKEYEDGWGTNSQLRNDCCNKCGQTFDWK